jgi:hypothetical protein
MSKKKFIIYDASKAYARYIRLHLDDTYDIEVYHKHQFLYLKEDNLLTNIAFVYVNSNDDLYALLWLIGKTEILIVGYSNPFFEYIIHRVDNIERLNLLQVKRDLLCQLKDLIYSKTQLLLI